MAKFGVPAGWTVQAFQFALAPTPEQAACVRRQFGGRRYARNWAVRTLKEDITRYRETGEETAKPSLAGLRKRWNKLKDTECVDRDSGRVGQALDRLRLAAQGTENLMPFLLEAVRAYATLGEIIAVLKGVLGTYQEPTWI